MSKKELVTEKVHPTFLSINNYKYDDWKTKFNDFNVGGSTTAECLIIEVLISFLYQ